MNAFVLKSRQKAYAELLEFGLVSIRNYARVGRLDVCAIEADHIHNLPSLLHEENVSRHHYYIFKERELYLERLQQLGDEHYTKVQAIYCHSAWEVLLDLARIEVEPVPERRGSG